MYRKELIRFLRKSRSTFEIIDNIYKEYINLNEIKCKNDQNNQNMAKNIREIREQLEIIDKLDPVEMDKIPKSKRQGMFYQTH